MLPVSGAEQLKASGAIGERPMISQSGAYSRFVSPAPRSLSGRNRFQRPRSRAFAFSCSMYIFVFFEYSNSMGASPGQGAPPIVSSPRRNGRAPLAVQLLLAYKGDADDADAGQGRAGDGRRLGDRARDGAQARGRGRAGGLRRREPRRGGRDGGAHRERGRRR